MFLYEVVEMVVRQRIEDQEKKYLSEFATKSTCSLGRRYHEENDEFRTCFQRDRDRILHCKAFRRLKHKTQVFFSPEGDHYRTRLTHTLEVAQIARTISRALMLNEDLTEAIALGHDLGHTPFGHSGEKALSWTVPGGFNHNEQSLRVVDFLEKREDKKIYGLNLTNEVRDGILCHSLSHEKLPNTLEGQVVRIADKIAYVNHDMDDAIRACVLKEEDIPEDLRSLIGRTKGERLNRLVKDLIEQSYGQPQIYQSEEMKEGLLALRKFMFEHVYESNIVKSEEDKACEMILGLYEYYMNHWDELLNNTSNSNLREICNECGEFKKSTFVVDYVAGMTDRYALNEWVKLFVPKPWVIY